MNSPRLIYPLQIRQSHLYIVQLLRFCLDAITEVSFFKQPGVSLQISDTKKERFSALTQTVLYFSFAACLT